MVAGFKGMFGRLRGWVGKQWISDVPGDIAACEFECKTPECSEERFTACERRKRAEALMAKEAETVELTQDCCSAAGSPKAPSSMEQIARTTVDG